MKSGQHILLLGSGELGKELTIELQRLGARVTACDRYDDAPAMQVAQDRRVFNMLDAELLKEVVYEIKPDLIVPEVEAIATDALIELEQQHFQVIPNARATQLTMNREAIRRLAKEKLGLLTANYDFAESLEQLKSVAKNIKFPLLVKPIMSSSGKGQSLCRSEEDLEAAWKLSQEAGRAGAGKVIVEAFVNFAFEITVLTLRSVNGTSFCAPIGHRQESGDYLESWQPQAMSDASWAKAKHMAKSITDELGGLGIFGVELFVLHDGEVVFSELSPRPHDTGMVTMATQFWSEFALHARAILGYPVSAQEELDRAGASAALKSKVSLKNPKISGIDQFFQKTDCDLRVFAKPEAYPGRRLAVVLAQAASSEQALKKALAAREFLSVVD